MRINLLNIGCFKNLVDSERLMHVLVDAGLDVHFGELEQSADIAIINTCGFIGEAEDESLSTIRRYARMKKEGRVGQLWIMGCYSQKHGEKLTEIVPEVDKIYGNFNWETLPQDLGIGMAIGLKRYLTTPSHYAFVKISEGCNQPCSYCIKPILNGPLKSEPMERVLEECRWLASQGVKEIQLVAQNLTTYGLDLYGKKRISELVSRISDLPGIEWIRLHYAYPSGFPKELLPVIRERENVCKYLDMAIQHSETKMLKLMRRGMSKESLTQLISDIRESVPGLYLRTTVMVGHPGETEPDYEALKQFVAEQRFERLGVFRYSHQVGSFCHQNYTDSISPEIKKERALGILAVQKQVLNEINDQTIGKDVRVIIDRKQDDDYIGRSEHSTPMADPIVKIRTEKQLSVGEFYNVRISEKADKNLLAAL